MNRHQPQNRLALASTLAMALVWGPQVSGAESTTAILAEGRDDGASAGPQPTPQTSPAPQRTDRPRERRGRGDDPATHVPELRDETFRLMDAYLISNLQESLGLSEEQFSRALPLVKKLQSDRRDFAKRRMQALRLLRKGLGSGTATEAGVIDLLKELKTASADERAGTLRNLEALDAVLSPLQQAKYRVFEAEVDLRLRHLLARSQDRDRSTKP
jgi:hypothetical protein